MEGDGGHSKTSTEKEGLEDGGARTGEGTGQRRKIGMSESEEGQGNM